MPEPNANVRLPVISASPSYNCHFSCLSCVFICQYASERDLCATNDDHVMKLLRRDVLLLIPLRKLSAHFRLQKTLLLW